VKFFNNLQQFSILLQSKILETLPKLPENFYSNILFRKIGENWGKFIKLVNVRKTREIRENSSKIGCVKF